MDPVAQKVWRRVMRDMRGTDIILAVDADVLRCYCEAMAFDVQAAEPLARSGPLVTGRARELVRNPLQPIVRDHREAVRLFSRELGMSPSARAGLRVEPSAVSGDIDDVLGPPPRLRVVGGSDE